MSAVLCAAVFAVALAAFVTEGAIGFGGTVIVACIGAQLVPLDVLLPAFVPINIALSAWLVARGARRIAWRMLVRDVAPPVAAGAVCGLVLFRVVEAAGARASSALALVFGLFVVALAALQLGARGAARLSRARRLGLLAAGGVAHGMFGTGGPMIVYVVRRALPDAGAFRATLAVLWLALNAALLASFASAGLYAARPALETGVVLAVALVPGLALGERVHRALDPARFERAVWILLLVAGAALVVRSAYALASGAT
jgi:hypothetical protein